jgi:phosphoribosylanthranilate isomerase
MREGGNIAAVGDLMPNYMGFIFVPSSPRYVGHTLAPEVAALPPSIKRIGVFRDTPCDELRTTVERNHLDGVQLHGDESDDYLRDLQSQLPSLLLIKAIRVSSQTDLVAVSERLVSPDLYLLDSGNGGTGTPFEWSWLESYRSTVPFLLAGGISLANIDEATHVGRKHPAFVGIDINSHFEVSPGMKNIEQIKTALARLSV